MKIFLGKRRLQKTGDSFTVVIPLLGVKHMKLAFKQDLDFFYDTQKKSLMVKKADDTRNYDGI